MQKIIIIPAEASEPVEVRDVEDGKAIWQTMKDLTENATLEVAQYRHDSGRHVDLWMDEEGKIKGLPSNERATMLAHHGRAIRGTDYVSGTCILAGNTPDGDLKGVHPDVEEFVLDLDRTYTALTQKSN